MDNIMHVMRGLDPLLSGLEFGSQEEQLDSFRKSRRFWPEQSIDRPSLHQICAHVQNRQRKSSGLPGSSLMGEVSG